MHTRYCVTYFSSARACVNTLEHICARQCQGHCRGQHRQNTDAAPLHAHPRPNTTHGVLTTRTAIHTAVRFHISHVSVRRSTLTSSLQYCDCHTERAAPTQPHHYLSLLTLCIHTSAVTTPMETRCQANVATPVVLQDGQTVQQRKKAGQLTQFSLTGSSTNYKRSALVTVLCQSCSGSQTVTAIHATLDNGLRRIWKRKVQLMLLRPRAPDECNNVPPILQEPLT